MKVNITPVKGKLLVKIEKKGGETKSGIKLVNTKELWQNETILAEVVSKHLEIRDVEVGDVVIIRGEAGKWVDPELVQDEEFIYRIIDLDEIVALVNQEE